MDTSRTNLKETRYRLSFLTAASGMTRYESALIQRIIAGHIATPGHAIVMPAATSAGVGAVAAYYKAARTGLNGFLLAIEWRFLKFLPPGFSGLGWRGRSIMPGMVTLESVFDTVKRLAPTGALSLTDLPSLDAGTEHLVLCAEANLRNAIPAALSGVTWVVIDGCGDASDKCFAGFRSAYEGADTTDFSISIWAVGPQPLQRVITGRNRTKLLYLLNQAALWDRITSCLLPALADLRSSPPGQPPAADAGLASPTGESAQRDQAGPEIRQLLSYCAVASVRLGRILVRQVSGKRRWSIVIARGDPLRGQLHDPVQIIAPEGFFYADPMLYGPVDGRMYCFVEEFDYSSGKAVIAVLAEHDDGSWKRLGAALDEPFHLSFPYLFNYQGQLFMCPEAYLSNRITVYRCTDFPLGWRRETVIMDDVSAADSVIFESDGRWWLLTNIDHASSADHQAELHVFHADNPLSTTWTPVAGNPVKVDASGGRNGGFFRDGANLFRCGQCQSLEAYGAGLTVYRITALSPDRYAEVQVGTLTVPASIVGSGTHTLARAGAHYAIDVLG